MDDRGRSVGLHQGAIIQDMKEEVERAKNKNKNKNRSGAEGQASEPLSNPLHLMKGFVWELAMERAWKEYNGHLVVPQSECQVDGIYLTPDGLDATDGSLPEYKATVKGSRQSGFEVVRTKANPQGILKPIEGSSWTDAYQTWLSNFWDWEFQVQGYARALGCTTVHIFILWLCGDYRGNRAPQVFRIDRAYSKADLDATWEVILNRARKMKAEGHPATANWEG